MKKWILLMSVCMLFAGCQKSYTRSEYIHWVEGSDSGCMVEKEVGDFKFRVQYKPSAYQVLKSKSVKSKEDFEGSVSKWESSLVFLMQLGLKNGEDLLGYNVSSMENKQRLIYYLSYDMGKQIYIEQGDKKVYCDMFHFERSYDLKKWRNFNLGFDASKVDSNKPFWLVVESDLVGGKLRAEFSENRLSFDQLIL